MNSERGIALVSALAALSTLAVIAAMVVATSQTLRVRSAVTASMSRAVYDAESAAHYVAWRLLNDRNKPKDKNAPPNTETFAADGRYRHIELNGRQYIVDVKDINSGVSVSGHGETAFAYLTRLYANDPPRAAQLRVFLDRLADYVDADNLLRPNGMEYADYDSSDMSPLPRNAPLQYREELLWIPGFEEFFEPENGVLTHINLITRSGMSGKSHLYSAPPRLIKDKCALSDDELARVMEILAEIRKTGADFDDAFAREQTLRDKLKREFAFTESGGYTISIKPNGHPGRTLDVALSLSSPTKISILQYQLR